MSSDAVSGRRKHRSKALVNGGLWATSTEEKVQEMHDPKGRGLTNDDTNRRVRSSPTAIKKHTLGVVHAAAARSLMHVAEVPSCVTARARRSYNATRDALTAKSDERGSVQVSIAGRQGP
jgi:hypothetical protein